MRGFLKAGGVIVGALVIATLGISASSLIPGYINKTPENYNGSNGCPFGMAHVPGGQTFTCVDIFEASANKNCTQAAPADAAQTQQNINESQCSVISKKDATPWVFVSREQAKVLCMRAGKRLPSAKEWYTFALGTPETTGSCNTDSSSVTRTGDFSDCVSASHVKDAVGNVWEWTSDDVIEGVYNGRPLPYEGFVQQVAADGIATVTGANASDIYGLDYLWMQDNGVFAIIRGGFYGSGDDAGVYAVHAKTSPNASAIAIGFRCVL
jgi:formylglycine-generating enzyme required for sulfatase activity